jgi:hypothetical protein
MRTSRYLNKYLFIERKHDNIIEKDALKYVCNREWRLWAFILKDSWCI